MRAAGRTGRAGFVQAALVAAALLLALGPSASEARTSLARRFRDAQARFRSLTESPTARLRPDRWDQAAARFRAIADANPSGAWADDASYLLAEVYHERFHTFHRELDLDRAIETYEGLVERHPTSPYADDALVQLGEIHYYQLGDRDQALRFYRRVLREHPAGDMADRARTRTSAIETQGVPSGARADSVQLRARPRVSVDASEATVGERALPGRPLLSSPGAVIGGRTNSRVPAELLPRPLAPEAPRDAESEGEATAPRPPRREDTGAPLPAIGEASAPPLVPAEEGETEPPRAMRARPEPEGRTLRTVPSRPLNPLLEEGSIPLRTPADRLPVLSPAGPRSQIDRSPEVPSEARADSMKDS